MLRRRSFVLLFIFSLALALPATVLADGPVVPSYLLDSDGQRVPAPAAYVYAGYLGGESQSQGMFEQPQDLFRDPVTGNLLVADTGNNRIVVLDAEGRVLLEIAEGLAAPEGVFVDADGDIWVADTGNGRVARFAPDGAFKAEYTKPESRYLQDREFSPSKIVVDRRGFIYLVTGQEGDLGVIVIDAQENFRGFFGRTRVPFNLGRLLARMVASKEQRRRMLRVRPAPLGNIHLDEQGFLYAVSPVLKYNQIQRLNSVGENVYGGAGGGSELAQLLERARGEDKQSFGESQVKERWDIQWSMTVLYRVGSTFIDVAVDDLGTVSALDKYSDQVYQYDQAGNLLAIFGGRGQREGGLANPTSIVAGENGYIYVLDGGRGNIQIFRPTALMDQVHRASYAYYDGRYDEAAALWAEIARRNTNFGLAHAGLGKALLRQGEYAAALEEYRYAESRTGYSAAFREYRYHWMRDHFNLIGLGAIGLLAVFNLSAAPLARWRRRAQWKALSLRESGVLWPVGVLLLLAVAVRMASLSALSFHFRTQRPEDTRLLFESGKILVPWITWCVAQLAVSEIFYGEGTFRQILVASAWALWPFILLALPVNLLTHWLTLDEKAVFQAGWWLIWGLAAWNLFRQVQTVHNFEVRQTLVVVALTLLGMFILWVLVGLVYALTSEIVRFGREILLEIYVRRF